MAHTGSFNNKNTSQVKNYMAHTHTHTHTHTHIYIPALVGMIGSPPFGVTTKSAAPRKPTFPTHTSFAPSSALHALKEEDGCRFESSQDRA